MNVYTVISIHRGVLYDIAVYSNRDEAQDTYHSWRQSMNDDDDIEIQTCEMR